MSVLSANGLSSQEANSMVAVGCRLMASGLAGAVGQGMTDTGDLFVAIMHPDDGSQMFHIGKERGRYVLRGSKGDRLADGRSLRELSLPREPDDTGRGKVLPFKRPGS